MLLLLPGLGAVSTTTIAGIELIRRHGAQAVGSLTQMGRMHANASAPISDATGLADLNALRFAAWDPISDDALSAARKAGVLGREHLDPCADFLAQIEPMKAAFDTRYVPRLDPDHTKTGTRAQLVEALRADIRDQLRRTGAERAVMVWCASTEVCQRPSPAHMTLAAFEAAVEADDPDISPSQLYAYAAILEGVPFANGSPNYAADCPALEELALREGVAIAGKDFKTGQTLMKTIVAPGLAARKLGVAGWFSTNILGNRDGQVLAEPAAFRTKESTKVGVLDSILERDGEGLYDELQHEVRINYYGPRGDQKEGWDNIDIFGWLGYPMQIKINFLCRDSILAAPLVLDIALLLDRAAREGLSGPQTWMSFFFKGPHVAAQDVPVHDLFAQERMLHEQLARFAASTGSARKLERASAE